MLYAGVVELADTIDLGSIAFACRFKSCHPHQLKVISIWILLLIYTGYMMQNRKAEGFSKPHASVMQLQHNLWRGAVQDVLSPAPKRNAEGISSTSIFALRKYIVVCRDALQSILVFYRLYDAEPKSQRLFQAPRFGNAITT